MLSATPLNGGEWAYGSRITFSFAPDGTSVGGIASNLNSKLSVSVGAAWQASFEKAAALWSAAADINIALVNDNGADFGVAGNQQGDSRFGDIRIGMIPQSGPILAFAMSPPPINGGTNAGDIVLNSNVNFGSSGYDLTTVAIHEFGHALGLDHAPASNDVLSAYYNGLNQTVSSGDAAGLASLYGVYPTALNANSKSTTATPLPLNANGTATSNIDSLNGPTSLDWYSVVAPSNTNGTLSVTVQTNDLSSASPRVVIYASNGTTGLAQATAPNVFGTSVTATTAATPGATYLIKVLPAASVGAYGNFGVLVSFTGATPTPITPPTTSVAGTSDQSGGALSDTDGTGQTLLQRVVSELNDAVAKIESKNKIKDKDLQKSLNDVVTLQTYLQNHGSPNDPVLLATQVLVTALNSGDPNAELGAAQDFLSNVVQAGTITTFGDDLTIRQYQTSDTTKDSASASVNNTPSSTPTKIDTNEPGIVWTADDNTASITSVDTHSNRDSHHKS